MKQRSFFERLFNIHDSTDTGVWIRSTRSLRQLIGVLGMALPILLIVFSDCKDIPLESISHYYYTRAGDFFTVILSLIGIFLIFYTKDFCNANVGMLLWALDVSFLVSQFVHVLSTYVDFVPRGPRTAFFQIQYPRTAVGQES